MIKNTTIDFQSKKQLAFKDITDEVEKIVEKTKIKKGNVLVFSTHTTLAICINEKEKGIVKDFRNLINRLIPKDAYYYHNDLNVRTENLVCQSAASDCLNGHSHCAHLLMRNSETIPIIDGKMALGIWQRIFAIELDCCRKRKIIVQVTGE
ncbi:MAG TPA: secondary thiamine-phosphate synthase enzyme YjbQ [Candidatus Woesebacteria bacterium]|nr:secondary thiamine-phosphate synthase enzyme YjbQ [Candidatus Woesebacteria bacterium]